MKTLIISFALAMVSTGLFARDLSYKIGVGYQQVSTTGFVKNDAQGPAQTLNGIVASYGIAQDFQVQAHFAFERNFDYYLFGPSIRYDLQRLFGRDSSVWEHLNLYTQVAFLIKGGDKADMGITLQAPYLGFEILPFSSNNFAINSSAGVIIDFVGENSIGFTNNMFGDVGLRFYF